MRSARTVAMRGRTNVNVWRTAAGLLGCARSTLAARAALAPFPHPPHTPPHPTPPTHLSSPPPPPPPPPPPYPAATTTTTAATTSHRRQPPPATTTRTPPPSHPPPACINATATPRSRSHYDSLAERSKALAPGASPQGRGFEPHSCHARQIVEPKHAALTSNTMSFMDFAALACSVAVAFDAKSAIV